MAAGAMGLAMSCHAATTGAAVARRAPAASRAPLVAWQVAGEGRGTPAVAGGVAYFLSKHHEVIAVDARTGRIRWLRDTGQSGAVTSGSVVVAAGALILAGDYNIVAFDRRGDRRWRFEPPNGYGTGIYLGGTAGDAVFAGSPNGRLVAIDVASGTERWSAEVGAPQDTTVFAPALAGPLVVAGYTTFRGPSTAGIAAFDRRSGRERWRRALPPAGNVGAALTGGPVVAGTVVAAANRDGSVLLLDLRTGGLLRTLAPIDAGVEDDGRVAQDFRALAVSRGTLIAGSLTGTVVAYDIATGEERWRQRPVSASIAFTLTADSTGTVYVPYLSGELVALDIGTGRERWRTAARPGFSWAPAVRGDRVYVAASRGGFLSLVR
jgi:outer membrane protein assembly factor BamB